MQRTKGLGDWVGVDGKRRIDAEGFLGTTWRAGMAVVARNKAALKLEIHYIISVSIVK